MTAIQQARPRLALAAAIVFVALVTWLGVGQAPAAGERTEPSTSCANVDAPARKATVTQLRRAIRCLVNEQRAVRGLDPVVRNRSLQKASQRHSKAMVAEDCLAHRCGDEPDLEMRLKRAGYFKGARSWQYAENTGCGLSAAAMVANWMKSRYHRINILRDSFKDVGIGVTQRPVADRCEKGYATFAAVFAWRELKNQP